MKAPLALSLLYAAAVLLTACDPLEPITFVNETVETLWFYAEASNWLVLAGTKEVGPRSSLNHSIFWNGPYSWIRVAATREDGQWVFDRTYSTDEWKRAGRRLVVSSLTPIAPPSNVNVSPRADAPRPVLPTRGLPPPRPTPAR